MGFARQHKAKVIGGLLAAALVGSAVVIALTTPNADAATASRPVRSIVQLCETAALGQARCLAERQAPAASSNTQARINANRAPADSASHRCRYQRAAVHSRRLRSGRPGRRLPTRHQQGLRPDRRHHRRLRRSDRAVRPHGVPQSVRPARLHHRQRLLPEGEPERRDLTVAGRQQRLGRRDLARSGHGVGRLPAVQHPAGRGQQLLPVRPRHGGRHRGPAGREVRLQQLWQLRVQRCATATTCTSTIPAWPSR